MSDPRRLVTRLLMVGAGLALLACSSSVEGEPLATTDVDLFAEEAARTLQVAMRDLEFEPESLTISSGELVEFALANEGSMEHDLTIDRLPAQVSMPGDAHGHGGEKDVHVGVESGDETMLRLRVRAPGEYTYYCSVPGHRGAGMEGTLTVE